MRLEALLFDVDGTLADTERDGHRVAFNQAFSQAGLDWDWSVPLYGDLLGVTGGKERIRHFLECHRPDFQRPSNFAGFVADLHKAKTVIYTRMLEEGGIPLRPGVKRLLQEALDANLRLAITTTTTPNNVTALLRSTLGADGERWFELIAAGDIVPAKKPAPDIYHFTLQKMRLSAGACLAFEDSANGIKATRGADLTTLITINDYTATQDFSAAALVLDQFGEPEQPFRVLRGEAGRYSYVTVPLLNELHHRHTVS